MPAISSHVIGLMSLLEIDGPLVRIVENLSRPDYMALNKVLEALGGKWSRKDRAHVFSDDPSESLDAVMQTGEYLDRKRSFDQFDSPPAVVDFVLNAADIDSRPRLRALEPQAGLGYLATEAAQRGAMVDCFEIDPDRVKVLRENPVINSVHQSDFLTVTPAPVYNRVVMNPPFSKQQDIDHVLHALKFLDIGGVLVSVMSAGVLFRMNRKTVEFRELIEVMGGEFTRLPEGSFSVSGTNVASVVVKVRR